MRRLLISIALLLFAREALACGYCAIAAVDGLLPPVWLWFLLPLSWFVMSAVTARVSGVPFGPSLPTAFVGAPIAFVFGASFFGPLATIPLGVIAAIAWARVICSKVYSRR